MKKILMGFLLCLLLGIPKLANARLIIEKDRSGFYYYDEKHTKREVYFLHNYDTNCPVFLLNFGSDYEEYNMEEAERKEISLSDEDLEYIKDAIAIVMNKRSYPEMDSNSYVGIQTLIWHLWAEKYQETISYSFILSLVDQTSKVESLRDTYFEPIHYTYQGVVGEKMTTAFIPNFLDEYTVTPLEDAPTMMREENYFWFSPNEAKDYHYKIDSHYFEEEVHFYKEGNLYFIELSKPKEKPIYLDYKITEEVKKYQVHLLENENVKVHFDKEEYLPKETVRFSYELEEGYTASVHAYTLSGTEVEIKDNSFLMPEEDVLLSIIPEKIPTYSIFYSEQEGITWQVPKTAKENEKITISYQLSEHYHIKNIEVTTVSGRKISLDSQTFLMPSENVIISCTIEKDPEIPEYEVFVGENKHAKITISKNLWKEKEQVSFTLHIEDGYELDKILVKTSTGEEITVTGSTFPMPSSNVWIQVFTKKILVARELYIFTPTQKGITFSVAKTAKEKEIVTLQYEISSNYILKGLNVYGVSGTKIPVRNNTFEMPDEPVVILSELEELTPHRVFLAPAEGIQSSTKKNSYLEEEMVELTYQLEEGYELVQKKAYTIDGTEIPFTQNTFLMPKKDVIIIFQTKKKEEQVEKEVEETQIQNTYSIPNTKKNNEYFLLLFFFLLGLLLLKKM